MRLCVFSSYKISCLLCWNFADSYFLGCNCVYFYRNVSMLNSQKIKQTNSFESIQLLMFLYCRMVSSWQRIPIQVIQWIQSNGSKHKLSDSRSKIGFNWNKKQNNEKVNSGHLFVGFVAFESLIIIKLH